METQKDLSQLLAERDARNANGPWVAACGGTEKPFTTRSGFRLQYLFQPSTGKHAYINCDTDIFLTDDEAIAAIGL